MEGIPPKVLVSNDNGGSRETYYSQMEALLLAEEMIKEQLKVAMSIAQELQECYTPQELYRVVDNVIYVNFNSC